MTMKYAALAVGIIMMAGMASAEEAESLWSQSLSLGGTLTRGNSDTLQVNAGILFEKQEGVHKWRTGAEGNYGESEADDETTKNTQNAKLFYNYKYGEGLFGYLDANLVHDDIADVDYRLTAGPGLGYFIINDDRTRLSAETGLAYVKEHVGGVVDDYAALRFAQRYDRTFSEKSKMWESIEFLPKIEDLEDYLLTAELGVEAPLTTGVNMRLVLQDKYDSTPSAGQKHNDISLIAGVSIAL